MKESTQQSLDDLLSFAKRHKTYLGSCSISHFEEILSSLKILTTLYEVWDTELFNSQEILTVFDRDIVRPDAHGICAYDILYNVFNKYCDEKSSGANTVRIVSRVALDRYELLSILFGVCGFDTLGAMTFLNDYYIRDFLTLLKAVSTCISAGVRQIQRGMDIDYVREYVTEQAHFVAKKYLNNLGISYKEQKDSLKSIKGKHFHITSMPTMKRGSLFKLKRCYI